MLKNLSLSVLLAFLTTSILAANPKYFLSLTSQREGIIYYNNITTLTNVVPLISFNFSVTSPRDLASGLPTSRLQFTPMTVWKGMDGSSPILMGIMSQNRVVQATIVAIEEIGAGTAATTLSWKLTNGAVSGVTHEARDSQLLEKIGFVFQHLEIEATAGGKTISAGLDWGNTGF